ncbi:hypothetical protein SF1_21550 [Sphingobacterium faecium NBRC 15299]|uniref:hypothetical protein n=1 Tax=Sphingobacterium faecium TaxID=34087 RepID=UPI000D3C47A0|nr:hypothetical protein [Sphingobacterium faecium]PTX14095.1 hypothetical protein C8N37_101854 [Sphingobacterium faecium]GEM64173.1 hypothetical protein SF1_21550 [Sphingobacterium faecium NBRC 15299]
MKKIILPFFFLFIALLSCSKENVEKVDEKNDTSRITLLNSKSYDRNFLFIEMSKATAIPVDQLRFEENLKYFYIVDYDNLKLDPIKYLGL